MSDWGYICCNKLGLFPAAIIEMPGVLTSVAMVLTKHIFLLFIVRSLAKFYGRNLLLDAIN
jgi:hypothetical protein